jgi:hypothetical protein
MQTWQPRTSPDWGPDGTRGSIGPLLAGDPYGTRRGPGPSHGASALAVAT